MICPILCPVKIISVCHMSLGKSYAWMPGRNPDESFYNPDAKSVTTLFHWSYILLPE